MQPDTHLINEADRCVMCGLCLPHCPTYLVSRHEGESPRGRIALVKAFVQGELPASPAMQTHLQSCTSCLLCEDVCPADVSYHDIIDAGRAQYLQKLDVRTRLIQYLSTIFLTSGWGNRCTSWLARIAAWMSKRNLFQHTQFIKLAREVNFQNISMPAKSDGQGSETITIFPGCTGPLFDSETVNSAVQIVSKLGYRVKVPQSPVCCSALAQHSGQLQRARKQQKSVRRFLQKQGTDVTVSVASGCGQQLDRLTDDSSGLHLDFHQWLVSTGQLQNLKIKPLGKKILVHIPCSMRTNPVNPVAMRTILQAIPDLTLLNFDDNLDCCGAGGMQLLTPEDSNDKLLQSKLDVIQRVKPDLIVSSNIGCTLQLKKGIRQREMKIEIIHPVTLLNRQINHS